MPKIDEKFVPDAIGLYVSSVTLCCDELAQEPVIKAIVTFSDVPIRQGSTNSVQYKNWQMVQSEEATEQGVAVDPYGAIISTNPDFSFSPKLVMCGNTYMAENELTLTNYIELMGTPVGFLLDSGSSDDDDEGLS